MSEWTLSIDFGTTYTCAVVAAAGAVEVLLLGGEQRMPSAVLLQPDGGLLVGHLAELQAPAHPERLERNPKRRLGDRVFLLGGEPVQMIGAVAEIFRVVGDEARRSQGGTPPARVRLTHPARWAADGVYIRTLAEAANLAQLPEPTFIPEPVAAARFFAGTGTPVGATVAVYDLGGGTFDTSLLQKTADGFQMIGRPGGISDIGGEDFDEAVFQLLGSQLPGDLWDGIRSGNDHEARRLRFELRRQSREAKEALSVRPEWTFAAPAPLEAELRLTRGDLDDLIRDRVAETIDELQSTIDSAGISPRDLEGVYLAGGSSRIPLVQRMVTERLGPKVRMLDEPKTVVARGAALTAEDDFAQRPNHGRSASVMMSQISPPRVDSPPEAESLRERARRHRPARRPNHRLVVYGAAAVATLAVGVGVGEAAIHLTGSGGPHSPAAAAGTVVSVATTLATVPLTIADHQAVGSPLYSCKGSLVKLLDSFSGRGPYTGGGTPPSFSTGSKPYCLLGISTLHTTAVAPGTLTLERISGPSGEGVQSYGPVQSFACTSGGCTGSAPSTEWGFLFPSSGRLPLLDGTYRCIDSDAPTWVTTASTSGQGACIVFGIPASVLLPTTSTSSPQG